MLYLCNRGNTLLHILDLSSPPIRSSSTFFFTVFFGHVTEGKSRGMYVCICDSDGGGRERGVTVHYPPSFYHSSSPSLPISIYTQTYFLINFTLFFILLPFFSSSFFSTVSSSISSLLSYIIVSVLASLIILTSGFPLPVCRYSGICLSFYLVSCFFFFLLLLLLTSTISVFLPFQFFSSAILPILIYSIVSFLSFFLFGNSE